MDVFDLPDHPKAKGAYACASDVAKGEPNLVAILEPPPVQDAAGAVCAAFTSAS